jgi:hypothetical protein
MQNLDIAASFGFQRPHRLAPGHVEAMSFSRSGHPADLPQQSIRE